MTVELLEDVVDEIWPFTILVYPIEGVTCSFNRQRWYVESLAVGRDSGNARSDTKPDVVEPTQLLYNCVDLPDIHPSGIKNRLRIIENYEDLLR